MRSSPIVAVALLFAGSLGGCSGSAAQPPSLTITPSNLSSPITGPTVFTAVLVNSTDEVTWTATGGTLSDTSGFHVTFAPPLGTGMGTLTATAGTLTATCRSTRSRPARASPA